MPSAVLNNMAEQWTEYHANDGYFQRMETSFNAKKRGSQREQFLRWFFQENGKIMMRQVARWYDTEV